MSDPEFELARLFAQIFNGAGPAGWRDYVPDDGQIVGDTVYLRGVRMDKIPPGWLLTRPGQRQPTTLVRPKVPT